MLDFLRIHNLALIADACLEFAPGLNVLTGESGAGKSLVLRALALALGGRGGAEVVRPGAQAAVVEAQFVDQHGHETTLRREISAAGRSRCFLNGQLVPRQQVEAQAADLVLFTSQHGQQRLLHPREHLHLVDSCLEEHGLYAAQKEALRDLAAAHSALRQLEDTISELTSRRELLEYQLGEIRKVGPKAGEEAELLRQREAARSETQRHTLATQGLGLVQGERGLQDSLAALLRILRELTPLAPELAELHAPLDAAAETLRDVDRHLTLILRHQQTVDLDAVERRLWELQSLSRRLRRPVDEIVHLEEEISANLSFLDAAELERRRLTRELEERRQHAIQATQAVDEARRHAAQNLCHALQGELAALGFPATVTVETQWEAVELAEGVQELRPRFVWAPNPGLPAQPLDRIASGGELSRFLLAVIGLLAAAKLPSLIFDEIDAGIGGTTLNRVADRLAQLAKRQQILLVTHWPQLARQAHRHFHLHKTVADGLTLTVCRTLSDDERPQELARMSGQEPV
jgi:DNA repair protein RecN (Recombination protein N)